MFFAFYQKRLRNGKWPAKQLLLALRKGKKGVSSWKFTSRSQVSKMAKAKK
jgi:hypothetical protein